MSKIYFENNFRSLNPEYLTVFLHQQTKKLGINKWDIGASSSKDISVQVQKGQAKQLKGSQRNSLTLRVWNKQNKVGITSTSDLTKVGIEKAIKGAIEASVLGNKD